MSSEKRLDNSGRDTNISVDSEVTSAEESCLKSTKLKSSISERQTKFERAQKCIENAVLVSKRIKEHRRATAELLGRPFEDDEGDTTSEMASTLSERTGYSAATETSTTMSVQDALNIPGISESLANTLKQKELLMERIKQYKEISKKPLKKTINRKEVLEESLLTKNKTFSDESVQLQAALQEKENVCSVLQVRIKVLETNILDLQEKLNEKDQIIEAKNKATTLMSDSLSKKERESLELMEDTKLQMIKMQENFLSMETDWKDEKNKLLRKIEEKDQTILNLTEANTVLENSRFEIGLAHSKLLEEIDLKNEIIRELKEQITKTSKEQVVDIKEPTIEEKGSIEISSMDELTKKIELLEQINCQIRQTNKELENKLGIDVKSSESPQKKVNQGPGRKGSKQSKLKSPWSKSKELLPDTETKTTKNEISKLEMIIKSLNRDILHKEFIISQKEDLINELNSKLSEKDSGADKMDTGINTDFAECIANDQVLTPDVEISQSDMSFKLTAAEEQISVLNKELDAANKNMIKLKSNHKTKLKQMQTIIDNFRQVSDANAEIIRLNEEVHRLSQKIAELEEEKGNLQLNLVDYDSGNSPDINKKLLEIENLAEARLKSISVLETQKFDLVQELHDIQQKCMEMEDKLADVLHLQSEQVGSEIKSVQLEEQIDELKASRKELELVIENIKLDRDQQNESIKALLEEKEELTNKLQNYIQENIELTDKLEKLSAEKVSSAESIEIVESLTLQEKLELQEYNKKMAENKILTKEDPQENVEKFVEEIAELNRKIELYSLERQEVMEKMNKLNIENESLQEKVLNLSSENVSLKNNIDVMTTDKLKLQTLNEELCQQIDIMKNQKIEIVKEGSDLVKTTLMEEECSRTDIHLDEKSTPDKTIKGTKSLKQLTKDILKLKNIIKEREDEIADCHMKILSLEEQQQKQNELLQKNSSYEYTIKSLTEENTCIKEQLSILKSNESNKDLIDLKEANESLTKDMQNMKMEYSAILSARDSKIQELENTLLDYEKQIMNYSKTLQQKDKEMVEYTNQITKLNDVSQKLKSTIELLEEEKLKNQSAELVKSLNKQIGVCQKKLTENEEKLVIIGEEKAQLLTIKNTLENKNINLSNELKKLQETLNEKQTLVKDLQIQKEKHSEEMSFILQQAKERDEEIHEIKLQLRKESIENEKLRHIISSKSDSISENMIELENLKVKLSNILNENEQLVKQNAEHELKNKELMEKLKKFAVTIKKKSVMYSELENRFVENEKQLQTKIKELEHLSSEVVLLSQFKEKLKYAEEEISRLQSQKAQSFSQMQEEVVSYKESLTKTEKELEQLKVDIKPLNVQLNEMNEQNLRYKSEIDILKKRIVEYEIQEKNNINMETKISSLETEVNKKDIYISDLLSKLQNQEQRLTEVKFGHDAKVQEQELYIESLEVDINKYKNRICRLEESISVMEKRRHSLERKADQLDNQLQEKQKAYTEYTNQEDELINRLAILMDHDRVVEKRLYEIETENIELQRKVQDFTEQNKKLQKSLSEIQDRFAVLSEKANKMDSAESIITQLQSKLHETEINSKRMSNEHQVLLAQKQTDIEYLETEFNTQIELSIREKKSLLEKYEKANEYIKQLEHKLREYEINVQTLTVNCEELTISNQELLKKSKENIVTVDYTEQYINEINKLNSVINNKNREINDLKNRIQMTETNNLGHVSVFENTISEMTDKINQLEERISILLTQVDLISEENNKLLADLSQKDDLIRQLKEKNKVSFDTNIPKTEGMTISSTTEPVSGEYELAPLESQIVSDNIKNIDPIIAKQTSEPNLQLLTPTEIVNEPICVAKKSYLCFSKEENLLEGTDPFSSIEGWGFGTNEEMEDVTPGISYLNNQLSELKEINKKLKLEHDLLNTKLLKAFKKIKELKLSNDMLSNELKISKQMTQTSLLDSAIEEELNCTVEELEKKIEEMKNELEKERKEKDAIKRQNEVFNNANERLIEIKEKMDCEIELWKFKFKEANDKLSCMQWSADNKELPESKSLHYEEIYARENIIKLEKENDELQLLVEQLSIDNKSLSGEIASLKSQLKLNDCKDPCDKCQSQNINLNELQKSNIELQNDNEKLCKELVDLKISIDKMKETHSKDLENEITQREIESHKSIMEEYNKLKEELHCSLKKEKELIECISCLQSDLETAKNKLLSLEECKKSFDSNKEEYLMLSEKNKSLEQNLQQCEIRVEDQMLKISHFECENKKLSLSVQNYEDELTNLNNTLQRVQLENEDLRLEVSQLHSSVSNSADSYNNDLMNLEDKNKELLQKTNIYEEELRELNMKLQHLNTENDQLLSTVAELRSSVSAAVDQRGSEIAELWKQHLTQRETDFQKAEEDLRMQLKLMEEKYEQLLDSIQSSSQEETNKLVMLEQVSSLQNKLQEKEERSKDLQDKYEDVINQLDMLRSEIEDEKLINENKFLNQQEEYEKQIQEIAVKDGKILEDLQQQLTLKSNELSVASTKINELKMTINELQILLKEKEVYVADLVDQLCRKDEEIYKKTHELTLTLTEKNEELESVRAKLIEYEKKIEDLNFEKESELATLRLKMHEMNNENGCMKNNYELEKQSLTESLNAKIIECTSLSRQIMDLNKCIEEYSVKETNLRATLENQELEIVTLKDSINSLQTELRSYSSKIAKHVTFSSDTKTGIGAEISENISNREELDTVPRAELDLALYLLHQRDVRCEELTMELTQLLEERDTLQLRLSDCLRSYEDLKSKCNSADVDTSMSSTKDNIVDLPTFSMEKELVNVHRRHVSHSSSISEMDGDKPKLQAKLTELRSLKHNRDVTLRHESEQRQLDLRMLHRDVANLPPEAAAHLARAHHTLSRDTQSTSTVLLNWLRGKSTPRVVDM